MAKDEYDPFERAMSVINQVNRWMGNLLEGHRPPGMAEGHWQPPTDIYETPEEIVVCMEVAGVEPSSTDVHFEQGQLTASGYRAVGCAAGRCHQAEIENGRFFRRVSISVEIDEENVQATYRNGLLEIKLPKRKEKQTRKISVSDESEQSG